VFSNQCIKSRDCHPVFLSCVKGIREKSESDGSVPEPQTDATEEERPNQRPAQTSLKVCASVYSSSIVYCLTLMAGSYVW